MNLKEMEVAQLEERNAQILEEIEVDGADLDALQEEARAIREELEARKAEAAKKAEIRSQVATGEIPVAVVEKSEPEERKIPTMEEIRNSKAYIDAYAEYIKNEDDTECRALLSENATTGTIPVPEFVYDIVKTAWDREGITRRVRKSYIQGNLKVGFEISGSDATVHTEGSGEVSEETLVLGTVTMIPKSIKKWISISDEALDLRGEAFLRYIYDELTYKIAKKAADQLIAKIEACGTVSTTTCPGVPKIVSTTVSVSLVASAMSQLSDEAANPIVMMNKATWAKFKAAQYAGGYNVDPFEGLEVEFNNTIKSFDVATTGQTWLIVGDLDQGALMNFPNGEDINFKFDDISLATSDLVKVIGRMFVAEDVVAQNAFVKVTK